MVALVPRYCAAKAIRSMPAFANAIPVRVSRSKRLLRSICLCPTKTSCPRRSKSKSSATPTSSIRRAILPTKNRLLPLRPPWLALALTACSASVLGTLASVKLPIGRLTAGECSFAHGDASFPDRGRAFCMWKCRCADVRAGTQAPPLPFLVWLCAPRLPANSSPCTKIKKSCRQTVRRCTKTKKSCRQTVRRCTKTKKVAGKQFAAY